ncbi:uncharacterized protein PHALS_03452 [Plasmopara halstedii]|uniref:RxLR-like protein n=1 Tax=Plasmopara halstedii TaxID=4781 RepID=A0A0N7L7D5_PLAHL|nr:uncharacterized protein PHALS_03452 [Plasmopara halstedii]CEG46771.1 hypothetical protein PHALS_03452 [Plasmopara halstedii]|eukprot:XP_024583140.1 hypothetical protein PHALS_03452 [Plasmopara halstedii]
MKQIARRFFLLVFSISASNCYLGTQLVVAIPADSGAANNASEIAPNMSSLNESRTNNVENISAKIKQFKWRVGSSSRLTAIYDAVKYRIKKPISEIYDQYLEKLLQFDDFENALKSPEMEALINVRLKHNRKEKIRNLRSLIAQLSEKYGYDLVLKRLPELAWSEDYSQHMIKHHIQDVRRQNWLKDNLSIDKVIDLLQFGDDLSADIQNGNLNELREYIILRGREEYKNAALPPEYVDDKLVTSLIRKFGGEGKLMQQLSNARLSLENASIVDSLEAAFFRDWLHASDSLLWDQIDISNDVFKALMSGNLEIVHRYYALRYPDRRLLAVQTYVMRYKEDELMVALALMKLKPSMKEFATTVQHEMYEYWLTKGPHHLEDVISWLKIGIEDNLIITIIKLEILSRFIIFLKPDPPLVRAENLWDLAYLAGRALEERDTANSELIEKYDPVRLGSAATILLDLIFDLWSFENIQPRELLTYLKKDIQVGNEETTKNLIVKKYEMFIEEENLRSRPYNDPR